MASFLITDDTVTVQLSRVEKLEALHGDVAVPRSAITSARVFGDGMEEWHGLRMPGTGIPGLLMVGTLRDEDGGTVRATFDIPSELHGKSNIDIRLENKQLGISYYLTFEN